jgi:lysophospholipase L1-like esterase
MSNVIRITGYFVLGLLAASALAEIAFRVVEATPLRFVLPASEIAMYGPDPDTGYRHRANANGLWLAEKRADVTISNLGLRDRERSAERKDSNLRVVVIGDSLLEAVQVPLDSTAVAIAEKLVATQHKGAEVINLGLAGATPPVLAARLQSMGRGLNPDLAIVVINIGDFVSSSLRDDSAFTGYRSSPEGESNLSYGFRNGRGYRIRTSGLGSALYWSLDHSALARVLNSRKNVGFFAEFPNAPASAVVGSNRCAPAEAGLASLLALWRDGTPKETSDVLDAFVRDLAFAHRSGTPAVIVAARGFPVPCNGSFNLRDDLAKAVNQRFAKKGLVSIDLDALLAKRYGAADTSPLQGFGSRRGRGHFNEKGNEVLGNVLADTILGWQQARLP